MIARCSLSMHPWRWLVAWLHLGLAGCVTKEAVTLPLQHAPAFSSSGQAPVPQRWWTAFDDEELNHQVDQSLGGSYTLSAALQRLRAARALARREASDLFADVNGVADAEGTFRSDDLEASFFALGLEASYELDLWGRIESRVEAEELRASATAADYHAVALTLSAEIARTWYSLIEAHAQLELLAEQIETNETGLKLQEARFGLGQIRSADVLRQRQLVESTREQTLVVQARIAVLEHRLAVLQGQPPQQASYETGSVLPELPPLPDTGLPAELVPRRPDVRREFLILWAADRDLAAAVSDQYPRISLTGSVTTAAESPENLFHEWIAITAGQLIAPLLDGGQRKAEIARTAAVLRERVDQYGETVLVAFREVEDALAQEQYQAARIESLSQQVELARQASVQLREQYLIGETEYLDVLTAITQEQSLQRETLSARLDLVLTRIALYLALAGDFKVRPQDRWWRHPPQNARHE